MGLIFITGILLIVYFFVVGYHTHLNSKFPIIWLIIGVLLLVIGGFEEEIKSIYGMIPTNVRLLIEGIMIFGLIVAFILLIRILQYFHCEAPNNLSYIIVLGAQMKEKGPSLSLKRRLDRAVIYMKENQHTKAILSGGQGKNEPMTEAEGMRAYMESKGIEYDRLQKEEESVNTYQNLVFSKKMIPEIADVEKSVGIVTSNFHMYRAKKIAEKAGLKDIFCLSSKTEVYMLPTAITREILAIVKDFLIQNI